MAVLIPLDRIDPNPFQPRRHYDDRALDELADSIERNTLLQVPTARLVFADSPHVEPEPVKIEAGTVRVKRVYDLTKAQDVENLFRIDGIRVQLAFGHRRWKAFGRIAERRGADLVSAAAGVAGGVPVGFMPLNLLPLGDEAMADRAMEENGKRHDLAAVEEAEALQLRIERFGWTHEEVGRRYNLSRSAVSNKLRLLKLPEAVREMNLRGDLSEAKCRALVPMYVAMEEHAEIVGELEGIRFERPEYILSQALTCDSSEQIRFWVDRFVHQVGEEAARREAERKRREEPSMFEEDVTQSDTWPDLSAEIERINAAHNEAVRWITNASLVRAADDSVLERTVEALRPLPHRLAALGLPEDDALLERSLRITKAIQYNIDRCQTELEQRRKAVDQSAAEPPETAQPESPSAPASEAVVEEADGEASDVVQPRSMAEALGLPAPALDEPYLWSAARPTWPQGHESAGKQVKNDEIFEIQERYYLPLLGRYGVERISRSNTKEDLTFAARRAVQFVANLRCAYALTEDQLKAFVDWAEACLPDTINGTVERKRYGGETKTERLGEFGDGFWVWRDLDPAAKQFERPEQQMAWAAALVLSERRAIEEAAVFTWSHKHALQEQFDESFDRLAAAFAYHLFYAEMAQPIEVEEDIPDGLNKRERKVYRAIRDHAAGSWIGAYVRPSDEGAARGLAERGLIEPHPQGGWRVASVSAETSAQPAEVVA